MLPTYTYLYSICSVSCAQVQGELSSNCGGIDIEYDGTHVGQSAQVVPEMLTFHPNYSILKCLAHIALVAALIEQRGSAAESSEQKLGKRSIWATIPERYCHVGVHTAGMQKCHGPHDFKCRCIRSQDQHDASLHFMQCSHRRDAGTVTVRALHVFQIQRRIQHQMLGCCINLYMPKLYHSPKAGAHLSTWFKSIMVFLVQTCTQRIIG